MNERVRKFIGGIIVGAIIFGSISFYAELTRASAPAINYISPSNGATFVDIYNGAVNYTVNVTDADGDLQKVELWSNCTGDGTWAKFYDSGALGGVNYHNASGYNTNWSISGKLIYWRICTYDGAWANYTYSFRNEWEFGRLIPVATGDTSLYYPKICKNPDADEYCLVYYDPDTMYLYSKFSNCGTDWNSITPTAIPEAGCDLYGSANSQLVYYNGKYYTMILKYRSYSPRYYAIISLNQSSYTKYDLVSSIVGTDFESSSALIYYAGNWYYFIYHYDNSGSRHKYNLYKATLPNDTSPQIIATIYSTGIANTDNTYTAFDMEYYNGYLYLCYIEVKKDTDYPDLVVKSYDGNTISDILRMDDFCIKAKSGWADLVYDKLNDVLLLFFYNGSEHIYYRVYDGTSWSDNQTIPLDGLIPKCGLDAEYFNQRINLVFSAYPSSGGLNSIYMLTYPYLEPESGVDFSVGGRIRFPDATPNQHNVNSTVFVVRNVGNRTIDWIKINWSGFGDIQTANNIRVWGSLDNSTWTNIGTLDANGNLTISTTTWASGMPLNPREYRYMRFEILDVGSVPETTHVADYSIRWIIHFA